MKKIKSFIAKILVIALVISSMNGIAFVNADSETKAAELTEISWADFGLKTGQTTNKQTIAYTGGDTLNNTSFVGDVSMSEGEGFRYGSNNGHYGMLFQVVGGKLLVKGSGGQYVNGSDSIAYTCNPSDYDIETFADTRFTIKINLYNLTSDKSSANVDIYINDKCVAEGTSVEKKADHVAYSIDKNLGFANIKADANDFGMIKVYETLKKISWKDFGLKTGQTTKNQTIAYTGGDTLNNTSLEGDVSISEGEGFRYGSNNGHYGMLFQVVGGKLLVKGSGGQYVNGSDNIAYTCNPSDYGITTFADTRFTIKINLYNLTSDKSSANVDIYINDKCVAEGTSVEKKADHVAYSIDKNLGFANIKADANDFGVIKVYEILKKISWADFGLKSGQTTSAQTIAYTGGETLNNTSLEGDVSISEGEGFRYGSNNGHFGMLFTVSEGKLLVKGSLQVMVNGKNTTAYTCEPENYELETFADTRFTIKINLYNLASDMSSADVDIYVNNVCVAEGIKVSSFSPETKAYSIDKKLGFAYFGADSNFRKITVFNKKVVVDIPTGLDDLTWEEFGYTGSVANNAGTLRTASHLEGLNNTLFTGNVKLSSGATVRYGTNADKNSGSVVVKLNTDGSLSASLENGTTSIQTRTAAASEFGLDTFVNKEITLQIGLKDDFLGVWINGNIVENVFDSANVKKVTLSTGIAVEAGTMTPVSSRTTAPTGLKSISFDDWTAKDASKVKFDGKMVNGELCGASATVDSLFGTSLYELVKFTDNDDEKGQHLLVYGGATNNSWRGIRMELSGDNVMTISCSCDINNTLTPVANFQIDAEKAGIGETFRDNEFSIKLDTVKLGKHVLLYVSFDGTLYNDAPFVFADFADHMGAYLHYNSNSDESKVDSSYVTFCSTVNTLTDLYIDLAAGNYTLPTGISKLEKKVSKDSGFEWEEIEYKNSPLSTVGDYKVTRNDGLSDYIQEVVVYSSNDVGVRELVRVIRLTDGSLNEDDCFKYAVRMCDIDTNGVIEKSDVTDVRSILLGTYSKEESIEVSGFFAPYGTLINDETYSKLNKLGITKIIESDSSYKDDIVSRYRVYQELSYAQKYGMKVIVQDERLIRAAKNGETITAETVKNAIAAYENYPSFAGLFMVDEPKSYNYTPKREDGQPWKEYIDSYKTLSPVIKSLGLEAWSNTYGIESNHYTKAKLKYNQYLYMKQFANDLSMSFISSTYYPFNWNPSKYTNDIEQSNMFFTNLAMTKKVADDKNIEFRAFVQNGQGFEVYQPVAGDFKEGEYLWNTNIILAFGAKEVTYFPLVHPESAYNYTDGSCGSGMLDKNGNTTAWYNYAAKVSGQINEAGKFLKDATNKGYMATGGLAKTKATDEIKKIELKNSTYVAVQETITNTINSSYAGATVTSKNTTYGAFTGCFELANGKHAMYIVNFDPYNEQTVTVDLGSEKEATYVHNGTREVKKAKTVDYKLAAGDGVLVIY